MAHRLGAATAFVAALAGTVGVGLISPAFGNAAGCGPGTVYDAPTDTCVVAPAPAAPAEWNAPAPPPPPPPPLPPISICPPIPFVAVCFPVN